VVRGCARRSAPARGAGGRAASILGQDQDDRRDRNASAAGREARGPGDDLQTIPRPYVSRGRTIKLHYYPDSLYIELKRARGTETREIVEGLVVDLDEKGDVVGFGIDRASRKLDLSRIETLALPPAIAVE
jgi:uncharacterized protein YuzE